MAARWDPKGRSFAKSDCTLNHDYLFQAAGGGGESANSCPICPKQTVTGLKQAPKLTLQDIREMPCKMNPRVQASGIPGGIPGGMPGIPGGTMPLIRGQGLEMRFRV